MAFSKYYLSISSKICIFLLSVYTEILSIHIFHKYGELYNMEIYISTIIPIITFYYNNTINTIYTYLPINR